MSSDTPPDGEGLRSAGHPPVLRPDGDPAPFRCPACRAKQRPQDACRRCGADLKLLLRAIRHLDRLRARLADAIERADHETERATRAEIRRFAPRDRLNRIER